MPELSPILIVGYGDLGGEIGRLLIKDGLSILGLSRSERTHVDGISRLTGDVTKPETLGCLTAVEPQVLIYCVAASEQSDDSYRAHYVDGLRQVLAALRQGRNLKHVFFVSSTRVYGQAGNFSLSETDQAEPSDFGGVRLLQAEQLLNNLPCGHTVLRLSGIYGPGRDRLLKLAIDPASWPRQNNWSNRIHRDDAAAFIVFLIHKVFHGQVLDDCYIVTDSCPALQLEVLRWLAEQMDLKPGPCEPDAPAGGKRLSNARMLGSGFRLRHPDYQAGYANLIEQAIV